MKSNWTELTPVKRSYPVWCPSIVLNPIYLEQVDIVHVKTFSDKKENSTAWSLSRRLSTEDMIQFMLRVEWFQRPYRTNIGIIFPKKLSALSIRNRSWWWWNICLTQFFFRIWIHCIPSTDVRSSISRIIWIINWEWMVCFLSFSRIFADGKHNFVWCKCIDIRIRRKT